jgi:UDP-N-acetylmuramyl pentapeptide synthase
MLLRHFGNGGHAVLPRDDLLLRAPERHRAGKGVDFRALERSRLSDWATSPSSTVRLTFSVNGEPLALAAVGEYNAMNACAAFAVGEICGVERARMRDRARRGAGTRRAADASTPWPASP